jgi:hypothetical protein
MSELQRKAARAGGASTSIEVWALKTSQYDHSTGAFVKKSLSERWHVFGDGRGRVQRDVYSAFLARNVVRAIDADGVITQQHDRQHLEMQWCKLEPALRRQGLFQDTRLDERRGGRSPRARSGVGPSCKLDALGPRAGVRSRGAARTRVSEQPRV